MTSSVLQNQKCATKLVRNLTASSLNVRNNLKSDVVRSANLSLTYNHATSFNEEAQNSSISTPFVGNLENSSFSSYSSTSTRSKSKNVKNVAGDSIDGCAAIISDSFIQQENSPHNVNEEHKERKETENCKSPIFEKHQENTFDDENIDSCKFFTDADEMETYLDAEKKHTVDFFADTLEFQDSLRLEAQELEAQERTSTENGSISEKSCHLDMYGNMYEDSPESSDKFTYWSVIDKNSNQIVHYRQNLEIDNEPEIILDENWLCEMKNDYNPHPTYVNVAELKVDSSENVVAFTFDRTGEEVYTLCFQLLEKLTTDKVEASRSDESQSHQTNDMSSASRMNGSNQRLSGVRKRISKNTLQRIDVEEKRKNNRGRYLKNFSPIEIPYVRAVEFLNPYNRSNDSMMICYSQAEECAALQHQAQTVYLHHLVGLFNDIAFASSSSSNDVKCTYPKIAILGNIIKDGSTYLDVFKSKSNAMLFISRNCDGVSEVYTITRNAAEQIMLSDSKEDSKSNYIVEKDNNGRELYFRHPQLKLIRSAKPGVEYYCEYHQNSKNLIIVSNHQNVERKGMESVGGFSVYLRKDVLNNNTSSTINTNSLNVIQDVESESVLQEILRPPKDVTIQDIDMFNAGLVLYCTRKTIPELAIVHFAYNDQDDVLDYDKYTTESKNGVDENQWQSFSEVIDSVKILTFPTAGHIEAGANSFYNTKECQFEFQTPLSKNRYSIILNKEIFRQKEYCDYQSNLLSRKRKIVDQFNFADSLEFGIIKPVTSFRPINFLKQYEIENLEIKCRDGQNRFPVTLIRTDKILNETRTTATTKTQSLLQEETDSTDPTVLLTQAHEKAARVLVDHAMAFKQSGAQMLGQMITRLERHSTGLPKPFLSAFSTQQQICSGNDFHNDTNAIADGGRGTNLQLQASGSNRNISRPIKRSSTDANTLTQRQKENQRKPKYLIIAYGAYGKPLSLQFRWEYILYLSRGWNIVFAHVRGGNEVSRARKVDKGMSVEDLSACIQKIKALDKKKFAMELMRGSDHDGSKGVASNSAIHEGRKRNMMNQGDEISSHKELAAPSSIFVLKASSAGGLLSAGTSVANFDGFLLETGFLDPLTMMQDPSQPLVAYERDEWGTNIRHLRSFSPLTGFMNYLTALSDQKAPAIYVTGVRHDTRVPLWMLAKFVACIRASKRKMLSRNTPDSITTLVPNHHGGKGRARRGGRKIVTLSDGMNGKEQPDRPVILSIHEEGSHDQLGFNIYIEQLAFLHKTLDLPMT